MKQVTEIIDTRQSAPLFPLGKVVATPGAMALEVDFRPYLAMHQCGFWGDVESEDWQENDLSVKEGFRILSAYVVVNGRFWIITEHNRSITTILLPSEY